MASLDVIRTLTIRAKTEGVDQSAASMDKLKASTEGVAAASVKTERATLSVDAALNKTRNQVDAAARAQSNLAQAQKTLTAAREQGRISQDEQNRLMQLAVRHFNSASDAGSKFSHVMQEMSGAAQGLSGNLGAVGGILARIGPAGLAIGATIGAAVLAFAAASSAALQLASDMGKLADTAEVIGLTAEKLRALQLAAGEVGVSAEQLDTGLTKFTASLGAVRDGSKGAVDSFNRLQAGLAGSVRNAKTTEEALNLVFNALKKADTASAALGSKEIFGKGGAGIIRLANATESIQELADSMNKLDKITDTQIKTWDDLGDRITKNMTLAGTNVKASFATPVLEALNQVAKVVLEVSRAIRQAADDFGFNIDTSSIENFRVELQILQIEIAKFGTIRAVTNLSDRLFGENFTNVATAVIAIIKSLASAFADLVSIISSAVAALASFATADFAGVARQTATITAAYQNLGNTISNFAANAKAARAPVVDLNTVTVQAGESVFDNIRPWVEMGNTIEKVGEITPPAARAVGALGAANELAAGKTKKLKTETEKLNPVVEELAKVAGQLGGALVTAFLNGDNAAKALNSTLKSISSSAASSAISNLIKGDFSGAAISGVISLGAAIGSFLFGGDDGEDQANQQKAAEQAAAARLAREVQIAEAQIRAADYVLRAANALEKSQFLVKIREFDAESQKLFDQESRLAGDLAINQLIAARAAERTKLITESIEASVTTLSGVGLTQVQQRLKDVKSAVSDLVNALIEQGSVTEAAAAATFELVHILALADATGSAAKPLSEIQQKVSDLARDSADLIRALIDIGISAEDAAAAISGRLNPALEAMRTSFVDELTASINELTGKGFVNEANELIAQVSQLRSDAAALGVETALIDQFYILSAQKIIDENELTGESFLKLADQLGLAKSDLHAFTAAVEDAADVIVRSAQEISDAIQSNQDRLFNAIHRGDSLADQLARFDLAAQREREEEIKKGGQALASLIAAQQRERINIINDFNQKELEKLIAAQEAAAEEAQRARDEEARAAKQAADDRLRAEQQAAEARQRAIDEATQFLTTALQNIASWIQHFLAGSSSPLAPSQRLAQAQSGFSTQYGAAIGGNRDALQNITQNAQDVVDAARAYYGSSAAGQAIISNIIAQLRTLPSQVSAEQFIVNELTPPIEEITDTVIDQTETLVDEFAALRNAFASGDAQALALALLPLFDRLDANTNDLLDFEEFKAGLNGMASDFQLRDMFTRLDTDNSGSLSRLELMASATQAMLQDTGNLDSIDQNTAQTAANTLAALSLQNLGALLNTETAIAQGVNVTNATLSTISNTLSSILSFQQPQLTVASQSDNRLTNINGFVGTISTWAPGSNHAMGGYITGGTRGRDSVHGMLTPGEFVVREPIARKNPWLADFNRTGAMPLFASNDNGGVVAALMRLERSIMVGIKAMVDTQLETAGIIARPIDEANKLQRTRRGEKKTA